MFVYGLLRFGFSLHKRFLGLHRLVGVGYVDGFEMYELGGYPGVVRGGGRVWGEVYDVPPSILREIDAAETGYSRERVSVVMAPLPDMGGPRVEAWMYVWRGGVDPSARIPGGDYSLARNLDPVIPYFSYGRNMNVALLREAVGPGKIVAMAPAELEGHARVFDGRCPDGVCASLHPQPGSTVRGALYLVRRSAFDRLDKFEGHPRTYARTVMPVRRILDNHLVYAVVYQAVERGEGSPACEYLCNIVAGLRMHGLLEDSSELQREHQDCHCEDLAL